eukprot:1210523-Prymnesium_polylepis.1
MAHLRSGHGHAKKSVHIVIISPSRGGVTSQSAVGPVIRNRSEVSRQSSFDSSQRRFQVPKVCPFGHASREPLLQVRAVKRDAQGVARRMRRRDGKQHAIGAQQHERVALRPQRQPPPRALVVQVEATAIRRSPAVVEEEDGAQLPPVVRARGRRCALPPLERLVPVEALKLLRATGGASGGAAWSANGAHQNVTGRERPRAACRAARDAIARWRASCAGRATAHLLGVRTAVGAVDASLWAVGAHVEVELRRAEAAASQAVHLDAAV